MGVDVGTGSVRAALVTSQGKIVDTAVQPIKTFNPRANFYEQSSDDIWSSVCHVVKVRAFWFAYCGKNIKFQVKVIQKLFCLESCCRYPKKEHQRNWI